MALSDETREALIEAAICVELVSPSGRELLLTPTDRAAIPMGRTPREQLQLDLDWLAIGHGERPDSSLARWLRRAAQHARPRLQYAVFERALQELPGTPELNEERLRAWRGYVHEAHARVVPLTRHASDELLDAVYVELQLDRGSSDKAPERTTLEALLTTATGTGSPRWVVVGEPGAGKSTLARHLAWRLADRGGPLPVFISLARVASERQHPFDVAEVLLGAREGRNGSAGLATALHKAAGMPGRLWVFLDGLDEVPPGDMQRLVADIRSWATRWTGAALVVLSRPAGLCELGPDFGRADVVRLDDTLQRRLLDNWLGKAANEVWRDLRARPRLQTEARNPLMLTLVALLARHGQALPDSRLAIYRQTVDLLISRGHGPDSRGMSAPTQARKIIRLLARALTDVDGEAWMFERLVEQVIDLDVHRLLGPWGHAPENFLSELGQRSGVLAPHEGPDQPWRFLHRSLRELLTAETIWREAQDSDDAQRFVLDLAARLESYQVGRWGEPLAMVGAELDDQYGFLQRLHEVNPQLALRALPNLDRIDPAQAAAYLAANLGDDIDGIVTAARRTGLSDEAIADALLKVVGPTTSPSRLAELHLAISEVHTAPARHIFFGRADRLDTQPSLDWVNVPGGSFMMGTADPAPGAADVPLHAVEVQPFEMVATLITAAQWRSLFTDYDPHAPDTLPATGMTWAEARLFCEWIGARLPTEAEWAYACRAGTTSRFWSGDTEADLARVAWFADNAGRSIQPVGQKPANDWGLYDMHGNVAEWCADPFVHGYCASHPPPRGTPRSRGRVVRGGHFAAPAERCRSAARTEASPDARLGSVGFRPVRDGERD